MKIKLTSNKTNLGFSGGMNVAIKKALKNNSKYILILNNDVVVKPEIINELISAFKNNNVGIAGSLISYFEKPEKIWFGGGILNSIFCYTRHKNMNKSINNSKSSCSDFITGACMMIKKEVFEKIGFFDEDYFLYWEDVDFCQRAKRFGYLSFLSGKPLVKHKISAASGEKGSNRLSPLRAYYYARNPFLFIKKQKYRKFYLLTGLFGQIFIRLPYYLFTLENFTALREYLTGFKDGFLYLLLS